MPAGAFTIEVSSNAEAVSRDLAAFAHDQVPYACSRALNRMAATLVDDERELMRKKFTVRSAWMVRAFGFKRSHKSDWPNISVEVGHPFWALKIQEEGGAKTGGQKHPGETYVPTRIVAAMRSPNTGKLPDNMYPDKLLESGNAYKTTMPRFGTVLKAVAGVTAVLARTGRPTLTGNLTFTSARGGRKAVSGKLSVLYLVRSQARIPPRFGFFDEAVKRVSATYGDVFREELLEAVRTSNKASVDSSFFR